MNEKKVVVGIIGGTFSGNRGAESMLVSTIGRIREMFPNSVYFIYSYYPKQDRELINQTSIQILSCKPTSLVFHFFPFASIEWLFKKFGKHFPARYTSKEIRTLSECSILLDIGGVSFVDGREKFLPFNILTILPAMLLNVPVVKLAQAMGPFKNPINRYLAKLLLPHCQMIFARGDKTFSNLKSLNLTNVRKASDIAFIYENQDSLTIENEDLVQILENKMIDLKNKGRIIIGISPSSLVYKKSKEYLLQLTKLIQDLAGKNVNFLMIANANRQDSDKTKNNDLIVLRALQDEIKNSLPLEVYQSMDWAIWNANTKSQRRLISLCDLLVTSRFHSMISSLALGIPVMVVGWSHKYKEVLDDFNLDEYALNYDLSGVNVSDIALSILKNEKQFKNKIATNLPAVKEKSQSQFSYIKETIG